MSPSTSGETTNHSFSSSHKLTPIHVPRGEPSEDSALENSLRMLPESPRSWKPSSGLQLSLGFVATILSILDSGTRSLIPRVGVLKDRTSGIISVPFSGLLVCIQLEVPGANQK